MTIKNNQIFSDIYCDLKTNWAWLTTIVLELTDLMFPSGTMKAIIDHMQMISMAVFQEKLIYAHQNLNVIQFLHAMNNSSSFPTI